MSYKALNLGFPYFRKGRSYLALPCTNDELAMIVKKGEDIQMVVSAIQTRGRGRRENVWHSSKGGLWISILIPNIIPEAEMTMLNISCGLACARACERMLKNMQFGEIRPFIRWPNDLMLQDRKLGGMLIEVKSESRARRTYILGIGINVNQQEFPEEISSKAISLFQMLGRRASRMRLLFLILKELEIMIEYIKTKGTEGLLFDWQEHSYELGRQIQVTTAKDEMKQGKVIGLGKKGELTIIDKDDEIISVFNGFNLKILDK